MWRMKKILISYHDIVLLRSRIHLKWINLCYCIKTWQKNYLSCSHFEDDSSPYISWSGSSIRISHTFVLFNNVTFPWINHLETWLHSDNTSCYYINLPVWAENGPMGSLVTFEPVNSKVKFEHICSLYLVS